ncbi:MAG: thiopurine S-methyltransferase [Hydrogenophilales bacterium 28-61-23]|nr:MAG: thiopurine S-methyltransferase [Hydrogenophilales bacterium 28-61-23]
MSHWEEKYRAKTIPWDRGAASPALPGWLEQGVLASGRDPRVLIPGCGRGHEALELARRGFQVTALDIAPTALEHLAAELDAAGVDAERVCADALSWQPAQPFDAIYEQTCLCALDPAHWAAYERQLFAWLRPGGQLFALFMQTDRPGGPPFHCALSEMRSLFADEHWRWPETAPARVAHPNGWFEFATVLTRLG